MGVDGVFQHNIVVSLSKKYDGKRVEITKSELKKLKKIAENKIAKVLPNITDMRFWDYNFDEDFGLGIKLKETKYWRAPSIVVAELLVILKECYKLGFIVSQGTPGCGYVDDYSGGFMKIVDVNEQNIQISFFETHSYELMKSGKVGELLIFTFEDLKVKTKNLVEYCIEKKGVEILANIEGR